MILKMIKTAVYFSTSSHLFHRSLRLVGRNPQVGNSKLTTDLTLCCAITYTIIKYVDMGTLNFQKNSKWIRLHRDGSFKSVQRCFKIMIAAKQTSTYLAVSACFKSGPTWARTRDHLIMSQVL